MTNHDPLHRLSLSSVLFIAGLLALLGFVYFADRVDAATLYSNTDNDAAQVTTGFATGYQNGSTEACINQVDFQLLRTGGNTSTVQANIVYGETPNVSDGLSTSTNYYSQQDIETSATTTSFYFSPCVTIPAYNKAWVIVNAQNKSGLQTRVSSGATSYGYGGVYPNLTNNGAGNINSSTLPLQTWYGSGDGLATGNETIDLRFPTDGMETPDFSNWVIVSNELNASKTYWFNIKAYLSTSTVSTTEQGTTFTDVTTFTGASSTNFWTIAKSQSLTPSPDGARIWTITAKICGEPYCFVPLATDEISLTTNYTSTIPDTPYTELAGPFHDPDDYLYSYSGDKVTRDQVNTWSAGNWCVDPTSTSWGDLLGFGLCRVGEIFFKPSDKSVTNLIVDFMDIPKEVQPFKTVYNAWNLASEVFTTKRSDAQTTLTLDMSTAFGREDATFTLLSSSTLTGIAGSSTAQQIRDVSAYAIWFTTFLIIGGTILL